MKAKTIALAISLVFVSVALGFQNNPQMGTWKLNEAKSKIAAGLMKLQCVIQGLVPTISCRWATAS